MAMLPVFWSRYPLMATGIDWIIYDRLVTHNAIIYAETYK